VRDRNGQWEGLSERDLVLRRVCTPDVVHPSSSTGGSGGGLVSTAFDFAVSNPETRADFTHASQQIPPIRTPSTTVLSFVLHPRLMLVPQETSEMGGQEIVDVWSAVDDGPTEERGGTTDLDEGNEKGRQEGGIDVVECFHPTSLDPRIVLLAYQLSQVHHEIVHLDVAQITSTLLSVVVDPTPNSIVRTPARSAESIVKVELFLMDDERWDGRQSRKRYREGLKRVERRWR